MGARHPKYIKDQKKRVRDQHSRISAEWMEKWSIASALEASTILADRSQTAERRCAAAHIVATCPLAHSLDILLLAASNENEQIAWCVANALSILGSRKATRPLLHVLRTSAECWRREAAIYALGLLADNRAAGQLVQVLGDRRERDNTRSLAADALSGLTNDHRVIQALLRHHNDSSVAVRFSVLCALVSKATESGVSQAFELHLNDTGQLTGRPSIAALVRSGINQNVEMRKK
jgi:HEAT repeat protein